MHVFMFEDRFVPLIEAGEKRHTIRARRKRPVRTGDFLSLRRWVGKPYRSPQEIIAHVVALGSQDVLISGPSADPEIEIDGKVLSQRELEHFARQDGFETPSEMAAWHERVNGLPFNGQLTRWERRLPLKTEN